MDTLFGYDDLAATPMSSNLAGLPELVCADRESLISRIMEINPSATAGFLDQFSAEQLTLYLQHLLTSAGPRGRESAWRRPGDTPAVLLRLSAA